MMTAAQIDRIFNPPVIVSQHLEEANGTTRRHRWKPVKDGIIRRRYIRLVVTYKPLLPA